MTLTANAQLIQAKVEKDFGKQTTAQAVHPDSVVGGKPYRVLWRRKWNTVRAAEIRALQKVEGDIIIADIKSGKYDIYILEDGTCELERKLGEVLLG